MLRPAFVVGGLYSEANGVAQIMRDLAAALGRAGSPVTVYGAECRGRQSIGHIFKPPSRWVAAPGWWLGGLSWSPRLKGILRETLHDVDVVHNHSVWMLPNSYSSRIANSVGKPVVITAHGTLEPWAIGHARWKKRAAGIAFQNRDLQRADCIHVNSLSEVEGIRAYGLRCPVAVIPNGTDLTDFAKSPAPERFREAFPELGQQKLVLFMGRLHAKKGLDHLLRAWGRMRAERDGWQLVIAGPDCGFESQARRIVGELDLEESVCFTGNVQGAMKRAALSAAEMFVLPSFSEGFSMAVLEAMSCGLPVLLTPGCNFPEAAAGGAGIEVEPSVEGTADGLRRLLATGRAELAEMGLRGRALIERHYTWDSVARQTLDLYDWLINGSEMPEFVYEN